MSQHQRLLYISRVATPQQVKFCEALQQYFDAEFWFYEYPDRTRGAYWRIDLGAHCKVLERVLFATSSPLSGRYVPRNLTAQLKEADPDILMLGGFSIPGNYLAYRWAKANKKKTVVFTERSRNRKGKLRGRGLTWRILHHLYRDVDLVVVSAEDAVVQFRDTFGFNDKVVAGRYAADLEAFFSHPIRQRKSAYTLLYPNRMIDIYNPLLAIDIFDEFLRRYPGSRLLMNASGDLGLSCRSYIEKLEIDDNVEFLTNIRHWNDLPWEYARADMMLLPARFSNGNFTILEAMASGMGIVISDRILGIGKMVEDGVNGFRCPPDRDLFVERLERYVRMPEIFEKHALLNRNKVAPLGVKGTAEYMANLLSEHLVSY